MTFFDFILITLTAAALNRLWNYEEVTAPARSVVKRFLPEKPFLCAACNALWFLLLSVALWKFTHPAVLYGCVAFGAVRLATVGWKHLDTWASAKPLLPQKQIQKAITKTSLPPMKFDRAVVILTALNDFRSSYSVAIDVLHQARAIAMSNPTWKVEVWMSQGAQQTGWEDMPNNAFVRPIVPKIPWRKGLIDEAATATLHAFLTSELTKLPANSVVIEHDLLFVSWYIPFAEAMHRWGDTGDLLWFHVPHSMPGSREGQHKALVTVPTGRHFIAPVALDAQHQFAEYYNISPDRVLPVPNPFDARMWGDVSSRVRRIVTDTKLWTYDYVQILPACSTRLSAKGFINIASVFSTLNKHKSAFLLVCNPNASDVLVKDARRQAREVGLAEERLAFTSDLMPDSRVYGLSGGEIKTLMQDYGNLFIFPSVSESDSRVCMEAKLCRQYIVANEAVPALHRHASMLVDFGKTTAHNPRMCEFTAIRLLDLHNKLAITRHSDRHLEGIGDRWRETINTARL